MGDGKCPRCGHIYMTQAAADARELCRACKNETTVAVLRIENERLRTALQAVADEVTDESHEDCEDFDEACESLMKILGIARSALKGGKDAG